MNFRKWHIKYSKDCALKYPSERTQSAYCSAVKKFLFHFKDEVQPKAIPNDKIKEYLLSFTTHNTRKQMQCAINSFYKLTVNMPSKISSIPYPRKKKSLPRVIESQYLADTINGIQNLKHKAILMLAYSCALRISEVINLKIADIDSTRGIIHIRNAKGAKDRIVKLSDHLLKTLRDYYRQDRPVTYLFNGQNALKYSRASCGKIIKKYLGRQYTFHTLRHSGATAMLENDTPLPIIQKILGHNSIKTTMIYTHISNQAIQAVNAPM